MLTEVRYHKLHLLYFFFFFSPSCEDLSLGVGGVVEQSSLNVTDHQVSVKFRKERWPPILKNKTSGEGLLSSVFMFVSFKSMFVTPTIQSLLSFLLSSNLATYPERLSGGSAVRWKSIPVKKLFFKKKRTFSFIALLKDSIAFLRLYFIS